MKPRTLSSIPALQKKNNKILGERPHLDITRPIVNPELKASLYQMKYDVPIINYRCGINVNPNLVAIPCIPINERNGVVVKGKGIGFDSTEFNITPISWKSKLAFVPERLGTTADFSQKDHLAINSYVR